MLDEINRSTSHDIIEFITPRSEHERGCQVSMLMQSRGIEVFNELTTRGVMVDWREPNVIRVAPVPLYNRFEDVWRFGDIIKDIIR